MRPPALWLPALALLLVGAPARAQEDDEQERPEVEKIRLDGVKAVDKSELEESIATEESRCKSILLVPFCLVSKSPAFFERHYLDRDELRRDVLRIRVFYWKRGYREATVDTSISGDDDKVEVEFDVDENEPTRVTAVRVREARPPVLADKDIERALRLRAGEPLNLIALDSSIVNLRNELWEKGHSDAVVELDSIAVRPEERAAEVAITVRPRWRATVQSISIRGNDHVSARTIRNSLLLKPGGVYRRSDLIESQRSLYASNLFSHAVIIVPPQGDSAKHIEVTVTEAPLRQIRTSAGFNTVDFLQTEARFTHFNWFGGARRLDIRGVVGNILAPQLNGNFIFRDITPRSITGGQERIFLRPEYQASVEVTQPWVGSARNSLGISAFAHRRSEPAIYIDRGFGASASFTRTVSARFPVSLNYRFEQTEVQAGDLYFCVNYGVCEPPTIRALSDRQSLSPLSLSAFRDRTDDALDPRRGSMARADVEHASTYTGSDFRYNRVFAEYAHFIPVRRSAVLAARVRGGWVRSLASTALATRSGDVDGDVVLHPRKRFYAGGSQSVRGYGENQLGPRILTVDPQALIDAGCTGSTIASGACDPNAVSSDEFQPRPTGGTALLEGSVEFRFPIWRKVSGAVFVDGAFVGQGPLQDVTAGTGALTPGFGARYRSPVGPIRIDLGIRPTLREDLVVVTEREDPVSGERSIVRLQTPKRYDPLEGASGFRQVLNRLTLHLSIGQAF
ncbi:MAG TPA: BamA/TamA family outer membrane protein [Gemmatimonadaceae bacterium]|jgi:outer membrane protein assembly factor BamA|nr:BamA/TamA family outer membrane protein [Gemmatimonadaceae bacterium]